MWSLRQVTHSSADWWDLLLILFVIISNTSPGPGAWQTPDTNQSTEFEGTDGCFSVSSERQPQSGVNGIAKFPKRSCRSGIRTLDHPVASPMLTRPPRNATARQLLGESLELMNMFAIYAIHGNSIMSLLLLTQLCTVCIS